MALVFPNLYRLGMSNLGFQIVYDMLNRNADVVCERIFLSRTTTPPLSVESGRPLGDFPFIFFSVSFEQDYLSLVSILVQGGIIPFADQRRQNEEIRPGKPLVVCGGVVTFINPEPLAPFVDLFVVGEAEAILPALMDFLVERAQQGEMARAEILEQAACFSGCYIPEFYTMRTDGKGNLSAIEARENVPVRVQKVTLADSDVAGHSRILTPDAEFSDLFLTELGRGCSRGCRFCAAGFVYRPPRLWSAEAIIRALAEKPEEVKRVGLLGMEMARPADLSRIASYLLREFCSLSFSSLRADAIGPELLALLEESGLKTAAIAPDGGSERLRKVINKGLSEEELLWAAELLVRAGVTNLKLYFMIGLPTETWDDLEELVRLTLKIKRKILEVGRSKGKVSNLTLSLNPFVPKAWTPFQFCVFDQVAVLKKKIKFLRKIFSRQANMKLLVDKVENAFFQAMLARGDRKVGAVLYDLVQSGRNWQHVYKQKGVDPARYAMRTRDRDELFCWEVIDIGVKREYLWKEYQKALTGHSTMKCKPEKCKRCGACHGE